MLHTEKDWSTRIFESFYRVTEYVAFHPRVGSHGLGVVQFQAERLSRSRAIGDRPASVFEYSTGQYALEVGPDLTVRNPDAWPDAD